MLHLQSVSSVSDEHLLAQNGRPTGKPWCVILEEEGKKQIEIQICVSENRWLASLTMCCWCVSVVSVHSDHDVGLGHVCTQQHHPGCRSGLGLSDCRCRSCRSEWIQTKKRMAKILWGYQSSLVVNTCCFSGFKGGQGPGLGLHGAEPSSSRLLCLSDVHGELTFPSFISIVEFLWMGTVCFVKWTGSILIHVWASLKRFPPECRKLSLFQLKTSFLKTGHSCTVSFLTKTQPFPKVSGLCSFQWISLRQE